MDTGDNASATTTGANVVTLPQKNEALPAHKRAAQFVREHPVATIAGGLAIGAVAAALIPQRNRRYVAKQGSALADAIAAAGAVLAEQAASSFDTASSSVRKGAHGFASRASHAGEVVRDRAGDAAHTAYDRAQRLLGRKPAPTFAERVAERFGEVVGRIGR